MQHIRNIPKCQIQLGPKIFDIICKYKVIQFQGLTHLR